MAYVALARKYRPARFSDLAAQAHVAAGLRGAVAKNRVAHAYLLTGPRGVGKTSAARILAMVLNCEHRPTDADAGEPCGECDSCRRIWSGAANLDVVEIDAASNRGVDDARDLRERATYAASGPGRHKVYIVDEAHMLTREAWNALLKILEEPPPRVVFVFATTEPQKIANTAAPVMSRLQRFDFRRVGPQAIAERLHYVAGREGIVVEEDALHLIARVAQGGMRDALSLLDQALAFGEGAVTAARVREALGLIGDEQYAELLDLVADRRADLVFPFVKRLADAGADLVEFMGGAGDTLRALLVRRLGGQPEGLTDALRTALERHVSRFEAGDLLRMLKLLADAEAAISRSPHARLHVEMLLLRWALLDRTVELREVLTMLGGRALPETRPMAPVPPSRAVRSASPDAGPVPGPGPGSTSHPEPRQETAKAQAASPSGPLSLDEVKRVWPQVVAEVGRRRRMVQEALAQAGPASLSGEELVIEVGPGDTHVEGLERSRTVIAGAIEAAVGRRLHVTFRGGTAPAAEAPAEPKRLDNAGDRDQRMRLYRRKDPSLDAAADVLDLELLE